MADEDRERPRRRTPSHVHRFNTSMTKNIERHATRAGETIIDFVNRIVKERLAALDDES